MAYITIENFNGGEDRRRQIFSMPPGTIWTGRNVHVTNGGDLEKRKAFVALGAFGSNTFGLADLRGRLYTFGSDTNGNVPAFVTYVQLQHPSAIPMTDVLSIEKFDGKLYVVARFADGLALHFYDGTIVTDWIDGLARVEMGSNTTLAVALAALVDADAAYVATSAGQVITITAAIAGNGFTITTEAANGGTVDDQTLTPAITTPNVTPVVGARATYLFDVTAGDGTGTITALKVGGVNLLAGVVTWNTDNATTAGLIATSINGGAGVHGWNAASSGQRVTLTKTADGAVFNNLTVEATTTNTLRINNVAAGTFVLGTTANGVTAVAAVAQVATVTIGGTFEAGDRFSILLNGVIFGAKDKPFLRGEFVKTHKSKMYSPAGGVVFFCGVNAPRGWSSSEDPGAGFITVSNHDSGSQVNLALENYLGNLAIMAQNNAQIWSMQADDALNLPLQFPAGFGTLAPRALREFGGMDTLFLHYSGIRSLQPRQYYDAAVVSDIGSPIDKLVQAQLAAVPPALAARAVSAIEPVGGRFWLAIGSHIFVLSMYPNVKISAWSHYELEFTPDWFGKIGGQMFVRGTDNNLYLYGGLSGIEYDACLPEVQLPFITGKKEGTFKQWKGLDIASVGEWEITALVDPNQLARFTDLGKFEGWTYIGGLAAAGVNTPAFAPRLINRTASAASLSKITAYYDLAEEKA